MNTLIVYASKSGVTAKAANLLQKNFSCATVVNLQKEKVNPKEYHLIIVGSGIRAGCIYKEVKSFLTQYKEILMEKKLGLFICCALPDKAAEQLSQNFPAPWRNAALAITSLGGEINLENLGGVAKLLMKVVYKQQQKKSDFIAPQLDYKEITEFARKLTAAAAEKKTGEIYATRQ